MTRSELRCALFITIGEFIGLFRQAEVMNEKDQQTTEQETLDECFIAAKEVANEAGEVIRTAFHKGKEVTTKAGFADLVTETDRNVEQLVMTKLRAKFPNHKFIGEESTKDGEHWILTDDPTWIIDPIDGTTNFVHRFPYVAISMGFLVKKQAVLGIVFNPIQDLMYHARLGLGAYCNDRKISVTKTEELGQSLVCAEFGSSRVSTELDSKLTSMRQVLEQAHGIRSLGSAALNMCSVASGQADAYWEFGIHAWDIAAADLIVREAGGVVMSTDGCPLDIMNRRVLCAGKIALAQQIIKLIKQMNYERD